MTSKFLLCRAAALACAGALLTACAGPTVKSSDAIFIENSRTVAKSACVSARYDMEKAKYDYMSKIGDTKDATIMALSNALESANRRGEKDPCDMGIGYFEYALGVAKEQNESLQKAYSPFVTIASIGTMGLVVDSLFKTQAKTAGDRVDIDSGGGDVTYSKEQIQSDTEYDLGAYDSGTVTAGPTTVSGPDKHSETTIEAAPAATPAATTPASEEPAE